MSASPLTKHKPALHCCRFPSGDGAARLPATHRPPIAPPTPSRDVRSNRPATRNAQHTLLERLGRPRQPALRIPNPAVKSP
jgi:hypothetical protein